MSILLKSKKNLSKTSFMLISAYQNILKKNSKQLS